MLLGIILDLAFLCAFKYLDFLLAPLLPGAAAAWRELGLAAPLGVSFFTFKAVSYLIDTSREPEKVCRNPLHILLYLSFFPQLAAGPITRFSNFAPQLRGRGRSSEDLALGLRRFILGLGKKLILASACARLADAAFREGAALSLPLAWLGAVGYLLQIYLDFSGYSDMAIGLGRIMGFRFPENFDNPYTSASITEFWRRWHITLGSFMRNYLYIPLGGNRRGAGRTYLNLWIVFLLSGLWHGASWNYVLWGAYHGFFLVVERFLSRRVPLLDTRRRHPLFVLPTFIILLVGWAIFRIEDLPSCWLFIQRLFAFQFQPLDLAADPQYYTTLTTALIFAFITLLPLGRKLQQDAYYTNYRPAAHIAVWAAACLLLFFCLGALTATDFSPFIYFRF